MEDTDAAQRRRRQDKMIMVTEIMLKAGPGAEFLAEYQAQVPLKVTEYLTY